MADIFAELTGYAVAEKLVPSRIGVVPVGSLEYHGPHLPLGTDSLIAAELGKRVAEELDAVLFPLVAYTGEYWTKGFQGTIAIDGRVFIEYMAEILRGVLRSGLGGVLMLGAHGENGIYCPEAGRLVADEFPDKKIMFINWWFPLPNHVIVEELKLFPFDVIGEHGGVAEGSMTARISPESVDTSKADDLEYSPPWAPLQFFAPTPKGPTRDFAGYWGHVKAIDPDKGEILLHESCKRIANLVQELLTSQSELE